MQQTIIKNLNSQHAKYAGVFAISAAYFLAVSYFKGGLWDDELALVADVMLSSSVFNLAQEFWYEAHAPGVWLLVFALSKIQLTTEFALRFPSAIMAGLGVTVFVKLASNYLNRFWLVIFWLLVLSLQPLNWHASEIRPHIFLFCFGAMILYFLNQAHASTDDKVFFKNIGWAASIFSISIWFHFASFYLFVGAAVPFLILNRDRLPGFCNQFAKWRQVLFLINSAIGVVCAAVLVYLNLHSVLWSPYEIHHRFIQFTAASFAYFSAEKKIIISLIGVGIVTLAYYLKKFQKSLGY